MTTSQIPSADLRRSSRRSGTGLPPVTAIAMSVHCVEPSYMRAMWHKRAF